MNQGILGWMLVGIVAGVLARMIMPARDPGGFIVTILVGIAGALLAGYVEMLVGIAAGTWWGTYAAAAAGAVTILAAYRLIVRVRR